MDIWLYCCPSKNCNMAQITLEQRYEIAALHKLGNTQQYIADIIGAHKSSISRELDRNADGRSGDYRPKLAERKRRERHHNKPKNTHLTSDMVELIEFLIGEDYSPEQFVGYCNKNGINCASIETIYLHIWKDKKQGCSLYHHLRRKGRR
jgi:IS30 family transposase